MSNIDLTRNTAFKSLLGGVDAGHKTDSVKLGGDGRPKIGRSGLIGALTFRSARAEPGQNKAAEVIASAIVRCATNEMSDRIRANLGEATDVSPTKVLSALDEFKDAARTAAKELLQKKETPGGRRLTVADVRDAINKVNALANETLAGTSFIDKPRAQPPTARFLETRSPETLIHDAAGIISKAAQKDYRAGLEPRFPNLTEEQRDQAAAGFKKIVTNK
ncbi:MAG: hypothetical protein ACR652_20295 [Methylocystis sp.]|uniref:hypothetical protein n=1 Tax=Methylocystis sp. TaxID=1911079 RepID=UPI003DA5C017